MIVQVPDANALSSGLKRNTEITASRPGWVDARVALAGDLNNPAPFSVKLVATDKADVWRLMPDAVPAIVRNPTTRAVGIIMHTTSIYQEFSDIFSCDVASTEVARQLLSTLIDSGSVARSAIRDRFFRECDPASISAGAISEYRETCQEEYLLIAVSLLESFGERSWPALRAMARFSLDECELFMGLISNCPGIPEPTRAGALIELALRGSRELKSAIFERIPRFSAPIKRTILRILAADPSPDISDEASEYLEYI